MKTIKFRAWLTLSDYDDDGNDKDYSGMANKISVHPDGTIGFSLDDGQAIFGAEVFERAVDNGNAYEYEEWIYWEGQFELMQFTGLLDKDGKEIYEGDTLYFTIFDQFDNDTQHKGVVEFDDDYATFDINLQKPFEDGWQLGWVHNQDSELEVIGNIYENPKKRGSTSLSKELKEEL